jgi:hypothetical protein
MFSELMEQIRADMVPPAVLRNAARGQLSLAPHEMLEVLVELRTHYQVGRTAQETLYQWPDESVLEICANPETAVPVLQYFFVARGARRNILRIVAANPSLPDDFLRHAATGGSEAMLRDLLDLERVRNSPLLLRNLLVNHNASDELRMEAQRWLGRFTGSEAESGLDIGESEEEIAAYFAAYRDQINAEEGSAFELTNGTPGEEDDLDQAYKEIKSKERIAALALARAGKTDNAERLSTLQKIANMSVGDRIRLAMRGSRDERMILIRDRSKVVSLSVLDSPKINETEMESIAALTSVQEAVLRAIVTKRRFMKHYGVVRALVNNARTPLEVGMPLVAHLLTMDLHYLSRNKNVNETIRKIAFNLHRQRTQKKKD